MSRSPSGSPRSARPPEPVGYHSDRPRTPGEHDLAAYHRAAGRERARYAAVVVLVLAALLVLLAALVLWIAAAFVRSPSLPAPAKLWV